jgi:hypothetical protein
MKKALLEYNLHGTVIELRFPLAYKGYVIKYPYAISKNGFHCGVLSIDFQVVLPDKHYNKLFPHINVTKIYF